MTIAKTSGGVLLARNKLLNYIAGRFKINRPNWGAVVKRFNKSSDRLSKRYSEMGNLTGRLTALRQRESLEGICSEFPGKVVFDPVPGGVDMGLGFTSEYRNGELVVVDDNGDDYVRMSLVATVDGLPVLFETKLARSFGGGGRKKSPGGKGIAACMRISRIYRLMVPLRSFFSKADMGSDCGYVLTIYPQHINADMKLKQEFKESRGILLPFYKGPDAYRSEVEEVASSYKIGPFLVKK